ncbi:DegV family protein [uncultured Clostridium sp.]|uniref:DegV family protein n=1 Tax=uncultured Clostridium sp. TaxID=59620 RepID=UPI0025D66446|nr:DegV family protein [uncultured Clostridium sp.]
MNKFKIITDSGCDLSYEIIKEYDIDCIGLICDLDEHRIIEDFGKTISYKDFYSRLSNGSMPKTSQINPNTFINEFEKHLKDGYDIVYISLSSKLSGTYNSSLIARNELLEKYPDANITIIDSESASEGMGVIVYESAKQKKAGRSIDEIVSYIEGIKNKLYCFFTVKDLKHLERGGRISSTAAMVGSILNINPILKVTHEGTLENVGKIRGEKKALKELVNKIDEHLGTSELKEVFITHADNEKAVEYIISLINEKYTPEKIIVNYMGLAIGSHTGQGAVGIFFLGAER